MEENHYRVSDHLRAELTDDGLVLQARDEVGRGKRYGISGEISMSRDDAEAFAKWVFAQDLIANP